MAIFVYQEVSRFEVTMHHVGRMTITDGAQEVIKDQLYVLLRDACQHSLFDDLLHVLVFKLHDEKHVVQLFDRSFLRRHDNIINLGDETAGAISG